MWTSELYLFVPINYCYASQGLQTWKEKIAQRTYKETIWRGEKKRLEAAKAYGLIPTGLQA